jgi:hypothetical protein
VEAAGAAGGGVAGAPSTASRLPSVPLRGGGGDGDSGGGDAAANTRQRRARAAGACGGDAATRARRHAAARARAQLARQHARLACSGAIACHRARGAAWC